MTSATHAVTAVAHPNIALAKYWGKLDGDGNVPAVPSLSVTLEGMATSTTVAFDDSLAHDELVLNGALQPADGRAALRAAALLDRVRSSASVSAHARIVSNNDFPTASGLASSASGFAALALAAVRAAGLDWPATRVADLARRSSASAARSIFSGFVELEGGRDASGVARQVAPADALDFRVLVCVTTEAAKATSSTEGMKQTQASSPYYAAWVENAQRIHRAMREALLAGDFVRVGELAERSALAMHACALAAGVVYVRGATLDALAAVQSMRKAGMAVFATIDAGPHLKCLVRTSELDATRDALARIDGVLRVLETRPGGGARVVESMPKERSA